MKMLQKISVIIFAAFLIVLAGAPVARAATTPSLGTADTFGVLVNSFVRSFSGTAITGDLGYTTFSGTGTYTVSGQTHVADSPYNQAGTDQGTALTALNSQACDFTFASGGVIDLATDMTHTAYGGALGVYTPGVYCLPAVYGASIGTAGITLSGNGTYIFRMNGSLTTAANSVVRLDGASACNVFWTLADNAIISSLGAYSTFSGTLFDTVSLQLHNNVTWTGRAFLFGGSVLISYDGAIIVPDSCTTPPPLPATLHVIKTFYNDYGGTAVASDAILHVRSGGGDVTGSPHAGAGSPGTAYTLNADTYTVSENTFTGYTPTFSGDCDTSGHITLTAGDNKTCTISNDQNPPVLSHATLHIIKHVVNDGGGKETAADFTLHVKGAGSFGVSDVTGSPAVGVESPGTAYTLDAGAYAVSENTAVGYTLNFSGDCDASGHITLAAGDNKTCTITNDDINSITVLPATLHVIKTVINDNGGKAVAAEAIVHVSSSLGDVAGSPHAGAGSPGTAYTLDAGAYNVSENFFAGYTVKVGGDCAVNGNVALASGDSKTCTITNDDIAEITATTTIITTTTPPTIIPATCDICSRLTYDVYIINPDGSQRHTGTSWVRVTDRGNGVKRYSFEDATLDPHNPLYDYNDSVIDVDFKDCKSTKFMFVSSDASWKHQVRIKVSIDGAQQSDTLVANDSKAVVGTLKIINATTVVNTKLACSTGSTASAGLKGKILLQVEQHGEAWYVHPISGLRYYMKDGPVAYGLMRNFGLGITENNLAAIQKVATVAELKNSTSACSANSAANKVKGEILLQVQQHGEAWYVDVGKCRRIYLKDGAAAYAVMRFLGLGITDINLAKLKIGQ